MKNIIKIGLIFAVSAFGASTPSELRLKIYKVAFSTDALCTNPITVFEQSESDATYTNFLSNPTLSNGADLADGTYRCVIIEFSDNIKYIPTATEGVCTIGAVETSDVCRTGSGTSTLIDGTVVTCTNADNHIAMYISTASTETTGTGGHTAFQAPTTSSDSTKGFLLSSPFVKDGAATGTFVVNPTNKVVNESGSCGMQPPLFSFR